MQAQDGSQRAAHEQGEAIDAKAKSKSGDASNQLQSTYTCKLKPYPYMLADVAHGAVLLLTLTRS